MVFINKLYCMEGKAVLGISGGSAGTTSITAYASDNSVIGTINITVSNPILKVAEYYLNLSIAGGEMDSICLSTSLPADKISYVSSSANLEIIGYDKNFKSISFIGRVAGQYQIQISGGGETVVVNITVTSNDTAWMQYDKWISNLLSSLGCSKSDPVESFKKLGAWLVDNRDYDASNPSYLKLPTMGGTCQAFTSLFVDVAKRYFGLEADGNITPSGHINAVVVIDGGKWGLDAGSDGKAGSRSFRMIPQNPSIPVMVYMGGVWNEYK